MIISICRPPAPSEKYVKMSPRLKCSSLHPISEIANSNTTTCENTFKKQPSYKSNWLNQRHIICLVGFLVVSNSYLPRTNISVAMVAMVNYTAIRVDLRPITSTTSSPEVVLSDGNSTRAKSSPEQEVVQKARQDGEFVWTADIQGLILGAPYWGIVLGLLPSAYAGQRFGGKYPCFIGVVVIGVCCAVTPLMAYSGVFALCIVRALGGIGHSLTQGPVQTIVAKWVPPSERARWAGFVFSGSPFGTVIGLSTAGLLTASETGLLCGWSSSFYVFGCVSFVVALLWMFLVFESPGSHPWITADELNYIKSEIGATSKIGIPTPWKDIFMSREVWALISAMTAFHWSLFTLYALLPSYLKVILKFDIKENGLFSSVPYLARWFVSIVSSLISDALVIKGVPTTLVRKIMVTISLTGSSIFLMLVTYAEHNRTLSITLLTISMSLTGCIFCSALVNQADLAPNFSGPISSIAQMPGNAGGIVAPYIAGLILRDMSSLTQWRKVFLIASSFSVISNVIYLIFGSAVKQPWNEPKEQEQKPSMLDGAPLSKKQLR